MSWAEPGALVWLWGIPVLAALLVWSGVRRGRALRLLAEVGVLERLVPAGLAGLRVWQGVLTTLGMLLLVLSLAQPRLGFQWREVQRRGVDLVVLLDVSRSMDARDVSPSRMERGLREVSDLLEATPSDRVGLVVFAAGAYPRVPLTLDHDALRTVLREVGTGTIRAQGSSFAAAIDEGLKMLEQPIPSDRALVLVSDGEVDDLEAARAAATRAGEAGVPIFAIGVGTTDGAPIPLEEGGFKKDRSGEMVVSRAMPDVLRAIASASGGAYVQAVASAQDITALVGEQIHGRMEGGVLGVKREKVWNERFQFSLGLGLALLALGAALAPRPGAMGAMLLVGLLALPGAALAGPRERGVAALQEGRWDKAIEDLSAAHAERPDDMLTAFYLGQALYRADRFNEAEKVWETVAERATDPRMRAQARYNMGNAAYFAGRLTDAQKHYQRALEQRGEWEEAKDNADQVAREIAARTQQDQQQPPSQCDNPGQGSEGQEGTERQQGQPQQSAPQDPGGDGTREESPTPPEGQESPEGASQEDTPSPPSQTRPQENGTSASETRQAEALEGAPSGMSPEQAARLLDAVEEGSPRVVIPGESSRSQDW